MRVEERRERERERIGEMKNDGESERINEMK